jgi:hypothetical protein
MMQLQAILPPGTIPDAYANGSSEEQAFIQNLALFFTSFFKVGFLTFSVCLTILFFEIIKLHT